MMMENEMSKYLAGTRFRHITVHGMDIARTHFGDGFDTGDILVCDRRESNGFPRFLVVVGRAGDMVDVAEVGTMVSLRSADAETKACPALGVTVSRTHPYRIHDGLASFPDSSGVARPWDGQDVEVAA